MSLGGDLGSPDIAEDVAQSVLLRIHSALPAYKANGQAMAWAYRFGKAEKSLTAESWTKMGAWLGVADFGTSVRPIPQLSMGDEGRTGLDGERGSYLTGMLLDLAFTFGLSLTAVFWVRCPGRVP